MASSIDLSGQIAIVTGGSRGIGAAIAVGLARSGADVTIADLPQRREDSSKTLALIEESGGVGRALDVDVTDPDQIRNAVTQTVADKGRLDIMVNNAGSPFAALPWTSRPSSGTASTMSISGACSSAARPLPGR